MRLTKIKCAGCIVEFEPVPGKVYHSPNCRKNASSHRVKAKAKSEQEASKANRRVRVPVFSNGLPALTCDGNLEQVEAYAAEILRFMRATQKLANERKNSDAVRFAGWAITGLKGGIKSLYDAWAWLDKTKASE
jgi:hypothetical protein